MMRPSKILIVDDEPLNVDYLEQELEDLGYATVSARNGREALDKVAAEAPDLILLDVMMPVMDGLTVCRLLKGDDETRLIPIVIMTALDSVDDRIRGIEAGADDFLTKPVNQRELLARIQTALRLKHTMDQKLSALQQARDHFATFVPEAVQRLSAVTPAVPDGGETLGHGHYRLVHGSSPAMQEVVRLARTAATAPATVLLLGESGTGKEVMARAIHQWSPRATQPFVAVNCVALTPELLGSELFGHEKGAFTGAIAQKQGKFELAHGGTLFLDEIGDLAPDLQAKLLRVLQDKEFQRVGGTRDLRVDVRLIAATNRDLHQAMQRGTFREDLYYRLNVITLTLPPLRDRRDDIPALVIHFLARYRQEAQRPELGISPDTLALLQAYAWPGNVRELQNALERAVVLTPAAVLTPRDFPPEIRQATPPLPAAHDPGPDTHPAVQPAAIPRPPPAQGVINNLPAEAIEIQQTLLQTGGNVARAARLLGVSRDTIRYRMQRYGLDRP